MSQAEVVLKMVALEFILSLDELIYHTFVPRRLHIALFNMEPLHRVTCKRWELLWTLCKFAVLSIAVVLAYVLLLRPFFGKVHQVLPVETCPSDLQSMARHPGARHADARQITPETSKHLNSTLTPGVCVVSVCFCDMRGMFDICESVCVTCVCI